MAIARGLAGAGWRGDPVRVVLAVLLIGIGVAACGGDEAGDAGASAEPVAIGDHECAVCGMLVHAQPAPRGQVVHRDGERAFFCSVGDLLVHLSAPSPHGRAVGVWVEEIDPGADVATLGGEARPWVRAAEAAYVIGVPRRKVMGEPVLVYRDVARARGVAEGFGGALVVDYEGLRGWWLDGEAGL